VSAAGAHAADLAYLCTPEAVRERAGHVLTRGLDGGLQHFDIDLRRLPAAADLVAAVTRERFPDLAVPLHSRWRHFTAGGCDRAAELARALRRHPPDERVRAELDLAVTSVLLDAGAGPSWTYAEAETGALYARSEGLAVASFRLFAAGLFSSDPGDPWRADAEALESLDGDRLARALQVSPANPLPGLSGRAELLRRLGRALREAPDLFGVERPRAGNLLDALRERSRDGALEAAALLGAVLSGLGTIWPTRLVLGGVNLGDVWRHPAAGGGGSTAGLVAFHKLSQWLVYSLIEPLTDAGLVIAGRDRLTGLAEYRNGGLFIDTGVLVPRHAAVTGEMHGLGDEVVVEWRALTVCLLDRLLPLVRERLARGDLSLGAMLEGGTWAAGRRLAAERRAGAPPIRVETDGTVM
jgi:hypothetical protein